ncbi:toll-like receptor 7 [Harmonia axyridis]|uniref:toll-like receptor 7 n=1 Tax=Harmonia axyridis TaxID=115357 RepID=UPI001E275F9E|nr:toll-like receptor 7 [Harmonia axyridis]
MIRYLLLSVLAALYLLVKSEFVNENEFTVCLFKEYANQTCFTSDSMQDLAENITEEYSRIEFSNNYFPIIRKGFLPNLQTIDNIWIDNCSISALEPGAFKGLDYRVVGLDDNNLTRIESGVFTNHPRINSLYIRRNYIEFIHKDAFSNMKYLQLINLSRNRLKYWDPDWFAGNTMALIFFPHNLIEELPDNAFKFAAKAQAPPIGIDMRNNKIKTISDDAFLGVTYVHNLLFASNQLTEFGEKILKNTKTFQLDISDNKIECLPQDLSTVFKALYLLVKSEFVNEDEFTVCLFKKYANQTCFTSDSMQDLAENITEEYSRIEFSNNYFPIIRKGFLPNLQTIDNIWIDNCSISVLEPGAFESLDYRIVGLDDNNLTRIESGVFTNNPHIHSLYIRRNYIEFIHKDAFSNMKYLQLINLSHNRLKYWDPDWFAGNIMAFIFLPHNLIEELQDNAFKFDTEAPPIGLDMNNNKIRKISDDAFLGVTYVHHLLFASNQLTEFGEKILKNTKTFQLDISDNKIECLPQDLSTVFKDMMDMNNKCSIFHRKKSEHFGCQIPPASLTNRLLGTYRLEIPEFMSSRVLVIVLLSFPSGQDGRMNGFAKDLEENIIIYLYSLFREKWWRLG